MFLQSELYAIEHGLAEGIVLVDDANLVDVGVLEFVDLLARFVVIRGTNIKDLVL